MLKNMFALLFLLTGCTSENDLSTNWRLHEMCGRDQEHTLIYRIKTPQDWIVEQPAIEETLNDSKKAICTFLLDDIRITFHNFPTKTIEERIPPQVQITRWKSQFQEIDAESVVINPESFAGFVGYVFEATGKLNEKNQTMIAWSMQIAKEHYRTLSDLKKINEQRRADITIKALGPQELMEKHRMIIMRFAQSFELIDEIGYP